MDDCERLTLAVESFCAFVEAQPEAARTADTRVSSPGLAPGTAPGLAAAAEAWGAKEVLAHLVFYHELYVLEVEAALGGAPCQPPTGTYNQINARAAADCRGVPVAELTRRLRRANQALCRLAHSCDPASTRISIKRDTRAYPLAWLIPAVERHIRNHLKSLRKAAQA